VVAAVSQLLDVLTTRNVPAHWGMPRCARGAVAGCARGPL